MITLPFLIGMDWKLADDSLDGIDRAYSQKKFNLQLVASITYYVCQYVFPTYLSHFASEWTEIWHDDSPDDIVQA